MDAADLTEDQENLIHLIQGCFVEVPEQILNPFASFAAEAMEVNRPGIARSSELTDILHMISEFNAPSGSGTNDNRITVCHWPPHTKEERKDQGQRALTNRSGSLFERAAMKKPLSSFKHVATQTFPSSFQRVSSDHGGVQTILDLSFRRTYDTTYLSMRVLQDCFQDIASTRVVDIYTRRRPIIDSSGQRLSGTDPYKDDPALPQHHAHAKVQIIESPGDWILLAGQHVDVFFRMNLGDYENGGRVMVGDRERQVFYIDHMEYLARWASAERLQRLRSVLLMMRKQCNVRTSINWVDGKILERSIYHSQDDYQEPDEGVVILVETDMVQAAVERILSAEVKVTQRTLMQRLRRHHQREEVLALMHGEYQEAQRKWREHQSQAMMSILRGPGGKELIDRRRSTYQEHLAGPKGNALRQRRRAGMKAAADTGKTGLSQRNRHDGERRREMLARVNKLSSSEVLAAVPEALYTLRFELSAFGQPAHVPGVKNAPPSAIVLAGRVVRERVSGGLKPIFTPDEEAILAKQHGKCTAAIIRDKISKVKGQWMLSRLVIERANAESLTTSIDIDYSIDRLRWLMDPQFAVDLIMTNEQEA